MGFGIPDKQQGGKIILVRDTAKMVRKTGQHLLGFGDVRELLVKGENWLFVLRANNWSYLRTTVEP